MQRTGLHSDSVEICGTFRVLMKRHASHIHELGKGSHVIGEHDVLLTLCHPREYVLSRLMFSRLEESRIGLGKRFEQKVEAYSFGNKRTTGCRKEPE